MIAPYRAVNATRRSLSDKLVAEFLCLIAIALIIFAAFPGPVRPATADVGDFASTPRDR